MNQKSKLTFGKIFERFAYGCGDFGCNIIYTAITPNTAAQHSCCFTTQTTQESARWQLEPS